MSKHIPLTVPKFGQQEIAAVTELLNEPENILAEKYTKLCRSLLTNWYQTEILLTHSCTAALEMSALLLDLAPGDEVIIPSFTFVSTANAFALFGAKPIFVDVDPTTLNIDPTQIEPAITSKTKAIVLMHYAGVGCDMAVIKEIAQRYQLKIIEDAAQCIGAKYLDQHLGTFGSLGALSFHNTKNVTSGLGGALIINDPALLARAKIIWQKGTNREAFIEGQVDKYTWQDLGSSYVINELGSALLYGQLTRLEEINGKRLAIWNQYQEQLKDFEKQFSFRRPIIPETCTHNAHNYYLIAPSEQLAADFRNHLNNNGISASSHYVPLHLAPAGQRLGNAKSLPVCEALYKKIIRLPLWEGVGQNMNYILETIYQWKPQ
jgi:dTDP-4-amino-4,6-dideoxygalactose transaminase